MSDFVWGTAVLVAFFGSIYLIGGVLENMMGGAILP